MKHLAWLPLLLTLLVGCNANDVESIHFPEDDTGEPVERRRGGPSPHPPMNVPNPEAGNGKVQEVSLDGLKSPVPEEWVQEPTSAMRYAQFRLPAAEGDKEDAVIRMYNTFKGSADQNVDRWKTQFSPPGEKVTDVVIAGKKGKRLDVKGKFLGGPGMKPGDNYQMAAIHWEGPTGTVYHIMLTGPQKTVQKHLPKFDAWLKGFSDD